MENQPEEWVSSYRIFRYEMLDVRGIGTIGGRAGPPSGWRTDC
jgi:hypothetical protein